MINPQDITKYNRTLPELEEFLLFSILVAGKNSTTTAIKLEKFLRSQRLYGVNDFTPMQFISFLERGNGLLRQAIVKAKFGQYNRIEAAFRGIMKIYGRLRTVSVAELESIKGIGPKTARFFVLHTRENQNHAVLDTHILRYLRDHGLKAPKSTPSGKKYLELEKCFLDIAKMLNISPAKLDLQVWTNYSKKQTN
jgi:thermostable 8-oxoguanine DNA glycosylase